MAVLDVVKGNRWGMSPTKRTVSLSDQRFSDICGTLKLCASEMALGSSAVKAETHFPIPCRRGDTWCVLGKDWKRDKRKTQQRTYWLNLRGL